MSYQGVLILSSKFGEGHYQAGEALSKTFLSLESSKIRVRHLDFGSFFFKKTDYLMRMIYLNMVHKTPEIWRLIYEKTADLTLDGWRKLAYGIGTKNLLNYIRQFHPRVIVCTHFIPAGILADFRKKGQLKTPLVTVITDYLVHGVWIHPGVDLYVVGCEDAYSRLLKAGVAPEKITLTGIPVRACFEKRPAKEEARQKLGLKRDSQTVLLMGGAGGLAGRETEIMESLSELAKGMSVQFLIVCGADQELYNALRMKIAEEPDLKAEVYGYVDNISELMAASDLLITKGGALTISEALTVGLPLIMYKPIPGHENGNAYFVENGGAGIKVTTPEELKKRVKELLGNQSKLEEMGLAARKLLPSHSAENTIKSILALTESMAGDCQTKAII